MNTNTFDARDEQAFDTVQESAVQNTGSSATEKLVLILVWLAVSVPLIWGVMKAWDEAKNIF
jgi:ABC-type sulfate transport system permease subunit